MSILTFSRALDQVVAWAYLGPEWFSKGEGSFALLLSRTAGSYLHCYLSNLLQSLFKAGHMHWLKTHILPHLDRTLNFSTDLDEISRWILTTWALHCDPEVKTFLESLYALSLPTETRLSLEVSRSDPSTRATFFALICTHGTPEMLRPLLDARIHCFPRQPTE